MKKFLATLLALCLLLPAGALADGLTLNTTSPFADYDFAAQAYVDALAAWEQATGNMVDDASALPDETWMTAVSDGLNRGTLDVVFYPPANFTDDMAAQFVPVSEIAAQYPDLALPVPDSLKMADGNVYALPMRYTFVALYVNADLFESNGVALPTTWQQLLEAVQKFQQLGVIPISNALADWPHDLVDCAVLAAGDPADRAADPTQGVPASYARGMDMLRELYDAGAFGADALTVSDGEAERRFVEHEAAMRVSGEWLGSSIPVEQMETTIVLAMPAYGEGAVEGALVGAVTMGCYITRAAWEDDARREAAVSLVQELLTGENAGALAYAFSGRLLDSARTLTQGAPVLARSLMDVAGDGFYTWMAELPDVLTGSASATSVLEAAF